MCGFIAQLVEHRTGIAEIAGSNPVEALIFFRLLLSNCLNRKIHCDDYSSLSSTTATFIYELFRIYITSVLTELSMYLRSWSHLVTSSMSQTSTHCAIYHKNLYFIQHVFQLVIITLLQFSEGKFKYFGLSNFSSWEVVSVVNNLNC